MEICIIGLSMAGKTTIFNLLTGSRVEVGSGKQDESHIGVVKIPDERLHILYEHYKVPKEVLVEMNIVDFAPIKHDDDSKRKGIPPRLLAQMRTCDALLPVIRSFENPAVPHPEGSIMPMRDVENLVLELSFTDLESIDKRQERIEFSLKKGKKEEQLILLREKPLMERLKVLLESGEILRGINLTSEEEQIISGFGFLTRKPITLVLNTGENNGVGKDAIHFTVPEKLVGVPVIEICGKIELELDMLGEEDKKEFMEAMGIEKHGRERILRALLDAMETISFFTIGKDEVRAWAIRRGTNAVGAAGKVHTDMAQGFIRAEVVSFEDFQRFGSIQGAKEHGKFRLEGKEYIVQDGDIINYRFNI